MPLSLGINGANLDSRSRRSLQEIRGISPGIAFSEEKKCVANEIFLSHGRREKRREESWDEALYSVYKFQPKQTRY